MIYKIYEKFKVVGNPKNLIIEDNVSINEGVFINCRTNVHIGKNSRLSAYSKIFTTGLTSSLPRKHKIGRVILKENVWLGANSIITMNIVIGENSTISASSLIINNVDKNSLYTGIPGVKVKTFNE